jgi:hypothetical protein
MCHGQESVDVTEQLLELLRGIGFAFDHVWTAPAVRRIGICDAKHAHS